MLWWPHIFSIFLAAISYIPGCDIPVAQQWPMYEALRTTASIIMAIMGAWIGLVYPRSLERLLDRSIKSTESDASVYFQLLQPLMYSTGILIVILAVGLMQLIFKKHLNYLEAFAYLPVQRLRGLSFALLVYLTCTQIWTLILTLIPVAVVREQFSLLHKRKEKIEKLQSNVKRRIS